MNSIRRVISNFLATVQATCFTEVDQYNHDMIELRFELREHISREEWAAIFADEP